MIGFVIYVRIWIMGLGLPAIDADLLIKIAINTSNKNK